LQSSAPPDTLAGFGDCFTAEGERGEEGRGKEGLGEGKGMRRSGKRKKG